MAIYKCMKCGKIVEVEDDGPGVLICCGEEMVRLDPQNTDAAKEKHVPFIEKVDGGVKVRVGKETLHPMNDDHYIVYIQIVADGIVMRKYLEPGDKPEVFFPTDAKEIRAEELCNKHGVWIS